MKAIDPWRWEAYDRAKRQGHNQASACRLSGVSPASAERWERELRLERSGATSERRSSAWGWLEWRRQVGKEQAEKVGAKALAQGLGMKANDPVGIIEAGAAMGITPR